MMRKMNAAYCLTRTVQGSSLKEADKDTKRNVLLAEVRWSLNISRPPPPTPSEVNIHICARQFGIGERMRGISTYMITITDSH
jgi:hypothetical protein